MTKEVVVTISGLQLSDGDQDTIETVHVGGYHEKDGVHYVFFELEILEGHDEPVRNMIKLGERSVAVRKRGPVSSGSFLLRKAVPVKAPIICPLEHLWFLSTHPVSA